MRAQASDLMPDAIERIENAVAGGGFADSVGGLVGERWAGSRNISTSRLQTWEDSLAMRIREKLNVPSFRYGGVVPGPPGSPQLVEAHGGERFLGVGQPGGMTVNLYMQNTIHALDGDSVRDLIEGEFGDMIVERLRRDSEAGATVVFNSGISSPPTI